MLQLGAEGEPPPPPISFRQDKAVLEQPGGKADVILTLFIEPEEGYYIYSNTPGPTGLPTTVKAETRPDTPYTVYYPKGKMKKDSFDPSLSVETYSGPTPVFIVFKDPAELQAATLKVSLLLCSDTSCTPVNTEVEAEFEDAPLDTLPEADTRIWWPLFVKAGKTAQALEPAPIEEITKHQVPEPVEVEDFAIKPRYFQAALEVSSLGKAALFALLAGFILNFMPCVLPVISLKLSAIVSTGSIQEGTEKAKAFREHNIFFALGILIYFIFLSILLGTAGMAWGQLFQKPYLTAGLAVVVFGLGLSLFGVYDLPIIDLKGGAGKPRDSKANAFFTGVLATLLATPCSGPLLGGVLGWALLQPVLVVITVFVCIGIGMAMPYLLMAVKPGLVRMFPKPGNWTVFLERVVGFFLMATTIYLLNILPQRFLVPTMIVLLAAAFGAWMWGGWTNYSQTVPKRWGIRGTAILVVVLTGFFVFRPAGAGVAWKDFSADSFRSMLGKENIIVDFTADWCPNCKVLERTTLSDSNMLGIVRKYNAELIRADLTEEHPAAMALLKKLGSMSIPVVALFPKGDDALEPLVLRDLFGGGQLNEALEQTFVPQK